MAFGSGYKEAATATPEQKFKLISSSFSPLIGGVALASLSDSLPPINEAFQGGRTGGGLIGACVQLIIAPAHLRLRTNELASLLLRLPISSENPAHFTMAAISSPTTAAAVATCAVAASLSRAALIRPLQLFRLH